MSVNKTILLGNVGNDPKINKTQDGKKIATFSLATSEKWKGKNGEQQEKVQWHNIVVFSEGLVGIIEKYVKKGSKLFVEGSLQTRKWTGNDGQEKYTTEIVLQGFNNKLEIIDNRKEGENNTSENYEGSSYGEPSGVERVALAYSDSQEHAQRIYDYISKMWFMPATPILANGGTNRGLPISCFLNEMQDSLDSIADTWNENVYLASSGGGIGTHIGNIRSINEDINGKGQTSGVIPFIKVVDSMTLAISQGCYDDETEILTEKGFIKFADLKKYNHNLKVAQVTPNADNFEFVKYTDFIEYKTSEHLYLFKNAEGNTNLLVTGNHRMATQNIKRVSEQKVWRQDLRIVEANKLSCNRDVRFVNAVPKRDGKKHFLTQLERFLIAYQADGGTNPSGSSNGNVSGSKIYNFHFKKQRKIERMENILNEAGLYYTKSFGNDNDTNISVRVPNEIIATKHFNEWVNVSDITQEWACSFIEELQYWDGSKKSDNSILYSTVNSKNADLAQIIGIVAGYKTKLIKITRDITRQDLYTVRFVKNSRYTSAEKIVPEKKYYDGYVYCVTVPTG